MATEARVRGRREKWLLLCLPALSLACSASDSKNDASFGVGGAQGNPGINNSAGSSSVAGSTSLPPEHENESQYLAPVTTGRYLWTANPLSGQVALIDAQTLAVTLTSAGDGPTQVLGLPERDSRFGALVLNARSSDATLLRLSADGSSIDKLGPFRTQTGANAWALSPSGNWAIAWSDARQKTNVDPLETFQDITLFTLVPGTEAVFPLSVGARPSAFTFDVSESHAYAVTEEGISVIELGASPLVGDLVAVTDDSLADPALRDVSFAADGSYAAVRSQGDSKVGFVSLPDGARDEVDLGGIVTDLDLAPDGTRAFAVLGPTSTIVQIPLPVALADPATFAHVTLTGEQIGAIALNADASVAVVYTTVLGSTHVSLLDIQAGPNLFQYRTEDVFAPIAAMFPSPDPGFAVSFQSPPPNSKKPGAFALLSLSQARVPKIVATDAAPAQIAFSPSGDRALVTVRSDSLASFGAYTLSFANQEDDLITLASPPIAAGIVPDAGRAYVAQSHPEGRITFVSLDDGAIQTLTGFELAARILE